MSFLKMTSDIIKKILAIFREELLTRSLLLLLEIIEKENSRSPFIGIAGAFILCVFRYMQLLYSFLPVKDHVICLIPNVSVITLLLYIPSIIFEVSLFNV